MRTVWITCCLAALAALGWWNWTMYSTPLSSSPIAPRKSISLAQENPVGPAPSLLLEETVNETYSRPLFSRTRQKFVPSLEEPEVEEVALEEAEIIEPVVEEDPGEENISQPAPPPLPNFTFLGTQASTSKASALVLEDGKREPRWITVGDRLGDWRLREISGGQLTFVDKDRIEKVHLYPVSR